MTRRRHYGTNRLSHNTPSFFPGGAADRSRQWGVAVSLYFCAERRKKPASGKSEIRSTTLDIGDSHHVEHSDSFVTRTSEAVTRRERFALRPGSDGFDERIRPPHLGCPRSLGGFDFWRRRLPLTPILASPSSRRGPSLALASRDQNGRAGPPWLPPFVKPRIPASRRTRFTLVPSCPCHLCPVPCEAITLRELADVFERRAIHNIAACDMGRLSVSSCPLHRRQNCRRLGTQNLTAGDRLWDPCPRTS